MTLYAGGITMGQMDLDATFRGGDYHVVSNHADLGRGQRLLAVGNPGHLFGQARREDFVPALYDSFDTGHAGKQQQVSLTYDGTPAASVMPIRPIPPRVLK